MTSVVESIIAVFSALGDWFVEIIPTMTSLFYAEQTGLTFLGTLAIISVGIGLVLMVVGIIQSFLGFKGGN